MNRIARSVALVLMTLSVFLAACVSRVDHSDDPIRWSFLSGDGDWDANTWRWVVHLSPGETKSVITRLYNSGSERVVFYTVPAGPTDAIGLSPQGRYPLVSGGSIDIEMTATARDIAARGSHKYVINYGYSFSAKQP